MSDCRKLMEEAMNTLDFWNESAILEFTENMAARMREIGCSRQELAERMGVKTASISRILGGNRVLCLRTMVQIAAALGCELQPSMRPMRKV